MRLSAWLIAGLLPGVPVIALTRGSPPVASLLALPPLMVAWAICFLRATPEARRFTGLNRAGRQPLRWVLAVLLWSGMATPPNLLVLAVGIGRSMPSFHVGETLEDSADRRP